MQPIQATSAAPDITDAEKRLAQCLRQMQSAVENYQQALIHSSPTVNVRPAAAQTANKAASAWEKVLQAPLKNTKENLYQLEALLNQKRFLKRSEPHPISIVGSDQLDFEADFISIKAESKDEYDQLQLCQVYEHQGKMAQAAEAYKDLALILMNKGNDSLALSCLKMSYCIGTPSNFTLEHHLLFGKLLLNQAYVKLKQNHYISAYNYFKEALIYLEKANDKNAELLEVVNLDMTKLRMKHDLIREAFTECLAQINYKYFGIFENVETILYYPDDQKSTTWVEELFGKDLNAAGFNVKRSTNRIRTFNANDLPPDPNLHSARFEILIMSPDLASKYYDATYSDPMVHQLRAEDGNLQKHDSKSSHPSRLFDYAILIEKNAEIPWPKFLKKVQSVEDFTKEDQYYDNFFQLIKEMLLKSPQHDQEPLKRIQAEFEQEYKKILSLEINDEKAAGHRKLEEEESKAESYSPNVVKQFFQKLMEA